jgi:hypothetical protein
MVGKIITLCQEKVYAAYEIMHFPPLCIHWSGILRNLINMAKNVYIFLKYCICITSNGGAVVESQAADPEDAGLPPTCVL